MTAILLNGSSLPDSSSLQAEEFLALYGSKSTVPPDSSYGNYADLTPLRESDIPDNELRNAACTWSRTQTDSASLLEGSCTEKHIFLPTFQPTFAVLTWAHFHSKASQETADEKLQQKMVKAINALPRDRFISVRSLTYLDALVGLAYKKYSSGQEVGDLLEKCLGAADQDKKLSKNTITFLRESAKTLSSQPAALSSLRARLTDFYIKE